VLFATGRTPAIDDIGLDTVGLTAGSWLDVDTTCLVESVDGDWLYALGDVNHRALLTHQGKYQARTAGDAIGARAAGRPVDDAAWGDHATTADQHAVPQVFFTDPEAAAVGLTAEQAADAGHRIKGRFRGVQRDRIGAPVLSASAGAASMWSSWPWVHTMAFETPVADGGRDGLGVVGGVDDDHLCVVADDPHVVVDVPGPPSRLKVPGVTRCSMRAAVTARPRSGARRPCASGRRRPRPRPGRSSR
jgi:Pyridine nucleotide-disulphide oxidoreductase, dimerisation domain